MTHPVRQNQCDAVEAILFDAYGTLVNITDKRGPFRRLLQIGERQGRPSTAADAVTLMTAPMGLYEAAQRLGIQLTKEERARLEADLGAELASIRLFDDTLATLKALVARGYRLGLCSNLAADYAAPLATLLSSHLDVYVWSFHVGVIKPDPRIYAHSCQVLDCAPSEVLMVTASPPTSPDLVHTACERSTWIVASSRRPMTRSPRCRTFSRSSGSSSLAALSFLPRGAKPHRAGPDRSMLSI